MSDGPLVLILRLPAYHGTHRLPRFLWRRVLFFLFGMAAVLAVGYLKAVGAMYIDSFVIAIFAS